ncbi:MAG TPA: AAA family ATPase [Gammaproteobacteria bacterium]|nr:AAA family ATPase [Gammaproteobacteria bacterium]
MVIFINGSFGIGKTTVARLLVRQLPRSVLFDPEPVGLILSRLRAPWPAPSGDFQDLSAWRTTSIRLIRALRRLRRTVVVPMAFSNTSYLDQFLAGVRRHDSETFHFCLTAPLCAVRERLERRETRRGATAWQLRRSDECCLAHRRPEFAEHVATEHRTPQAVAEHILSRVRSRS